MVRDRKSVVALSTVFLLTVTVVLLSVGEADAVPGFARKYEISCNQCHNPWPNLNAFGRNFKENGYRLDSGPEAPEHLQKIDEDTWLEKLSILSGKVNGRLYDKTNTDDEFRLRAFHEAEIFLAGHAGNNISFLVVAEAEDEDDFNLFIDWAAAGWHPRRTANVVAGEGPIFFVDPYNTLADGSRRLTRSHKASLDRGFDAGFALRKSTQFVSFYGRAKDFFYSATVGTGNDDPEGKDAKDVALRLAYDFPVITVGGFYVDGANTDGIAAGTDLDWTRAGIDFQIETHGFAAYGMWLEAEDELPLTLPVTEVSNTTAYVEALYLFERNEQPLWYPLVRWETFEADDGADSTDAIAVMIGGFVRPNINVNLEYWMETSVPGGAEEDDRLTLFFNIGL